MPKITVEVHDKVLAKIDEVLAKYKFDDERDREFLSKNIDVFYAPDLGLNAGQIFEDYSVAFNPHVLMMNVDEFINDTVVHEIAHAIQMRCFPNFARAHGKEFKQILKSIGANSSAQRSNYDLSGIPSIPGRYIYSCGCTTFHFSTILHNRMMCGEVRKCTLCDNIVKLNEV